jgi:hypothetical protein
LKNIPSSPSYSFRVTIPRSRSPRFWESAGRTCGRNGNDGLFQGQKNQFDPTPEGFLIY